MASKYPFKTPAEIKERTSFVDASLNVDNLKTGLRKAAIEAKDFTGDAMYNLMISAYDTEPGEGESVSEELSSLIEHYQDYMANYALFKHFIWLIIRVSNNSVTVAQSEDEKTAYKYLLDEAKQDLLETSYMYADQLLVFMNETATKWENWATGLVIAVDTIVRNDGKFYKCTTAHTAGETFDATKFTLNWVEGLVIELDQVVNYNNAFYKCTEEHTAGATFDATKFDLVENVIFWQWTTSTNYAKQSNYYFENYRDFNEIFDINKSAYFYSKLRTLLNRVITEEINVRVNTNPETSSQLFNLCQFAIGFKVISMAISEFDYYILPENFRKTIDNEMTKSNIKPEDVKRALSVKYSDIADDYFYKVEREVKALKDKENDTLTPPYEIQNLETNSHYLMI